jgi:hypothetical protein
MAGPGFSVLSAIKLIRSRPTPQSGPPAPWPLLRRRHESTAVLERTDGTECSIAHLKFEHQATLTPLENPVLPRQGFSLPKALVMDEGFPPHTVGFMRRKRKKEQDSNKRGEQPSQS